MANYEHDIVADGAVVTWAGIVQVTAGPAGVRTAEIPQVGGARGNTARPRRNDHLRGWARRRCATPSAPGAH